MKVGIDLLFVKPQKSGGIESYIRNLLNGFLQYSPRDIEYYLFTSLNNHDTFKHYECDERFKLINCDVDSNNVGERIIWENLNLDKIAKKNNLELMFIPVYSKPFITIRKIPYITVIHDLQALHYPGNFSKHKYLWLKFAWKIAAVTSNKVVAISNFVKDDIVEKLKIDNVEVIYNPIVKSKNVVEFKSLKTKFGLQSKKYFYTVSSMLPHKNLKTLLYVIKEIKDKDIDTCRKLVISGVGGKDRNELLRLIKHLNLEDNIVLTGYVSDEERDCLYKHAKTVLFPSVFEGFGMPPIEAMMQGTPVVTTKETSIPEVTKNRAIYVDDPYSINLWIKSILNSQFIDEKPLEFKEYDLEHIVKKYIQLFYRGGKL